MKKFFSLFVALIATASLFAGNFEFKNFVLNADEEVVVIREIPTSLEYAAFAKKLERILLADDGSMEEIKTDGNLHVFSGNFQADAYFNPFAGNTNRFLHFTLEVTFEDGVAILVFSKMKVEERYMGWGSKTLYYNVTNKINDFNAAREIYADKKGHSKAERKEAEDTLDDVETVLSGSDEELGVRLDKLTAAVK